MDRPTEISDLPPEMLQAILEYLSLAELCEKRSVCKLWNELISSNVKVNSLVVDTFVKTRRFWYNSHRKPFDNRHMEICHETLFFKNLEKPILSQLKFLRLNPGMGQSQRKLQRINSFPELRRLDINYRLDSYLEIKLPKLETLKIWNNRSGLVRADCPKLLYLLYEEEGAGHLEMVHPTSVVDLSTGMYGYKISYFTNVETLRTNGWHYAINEKTLTMMPKLKRIYYQKWYRGFERLRPVLEQFIATKNALKRNDLQFYLCGVLLCDNLDEIDFGAPQENDADDGISDEYFFLRNYGRLQEESLELVTAVNYTSLMSVAGERLPTDYFDKFPNIEVITADGPVNQEQFLWFLQNLKSPICKLELENTGLDQTFYDALPAFCSLYEIEIVESREELNFDFLSKFEYLVNTSVNNRTSSQELSLDSARSLVGSHTNLKHFGELYFRFKGQHMHVHCNIHYYTRYSFALWVDGASRYESKSLDELIEWMNSNVFV